MKLYAGNAGAIRDLALMRDLGIGRMVTATHWSNPKEDIPWVLDNGAFSAWTHARAFPAHAFIESLRKIPDEAPPEWLVIPDKVAAGEVSLLFSRLWLDALHAGDLIPDATGAYLAVQDGMDPQEVVGLEWVRDQVDGLFIGGSLSWKWAKLSEWVDLAEDHSLPVHVGRVGTWKDLLRAERLGVDSVDSSSWPRNGSWHHVTAYLSQSTLELRL